MVSSRLRCRLPARVWRKALGLERAVAAQVFEVGIHMPQRQITGDGGLRDHQIRQGDGDPPPSQEISQARCRFPDPVRDADLWQGSQRFEELGIPPLIPRADEELRHDHPAGIHLFHREHLLHRQLEVVPPVRSQITDPRGRVE
jgi:hypothetical protein